MHEPGRSTQRTAEAIIAEIGIDMSLFPTDKQLASWAGMCFGNNQSAGKRHSGTSRHSSNMAGLDWALDDATIAVDPHMLNTSEPYHDLGGNYHQHRDTERITKRLIARLEALVHHVTLEPEPA